MKKPKKLTNRTEIEWADWLKRTRGRFIALEVALESPPRWRIVGIDKGVLHDDGRRMVERKGQMLYSGFSLAQAALCRINKAADRICDSCAYGSYALPEWRIQCSNQAVLTTVLSKTLPGERYRKGIKRFIYLLAMARLLNNRWLDGRGVIQLTRYQKLKIRWHAFRLLILDRVHRELLRIQRWCDERPKGRK